MNKAGRVRRVRLFICCPATGPHTNTALHAGSSGVDVSQLPDIKRKLTTILSADAANYSGRMARDEVNTVQALRRARRVIDAAVIARGGRIANTSGDGLIAEFSSVVEGVAAAVTIQQTLNNTADALPFRIGVHLGDVIVEGSDLLGDGVNLAARLQENANVGGILVSRQVADYARGRLVAEFRPLGPATPKNLIEEVELFAVLAEGSRHQTIWPRSRRALTARNRCI